MSYPLYEADYVLADDEYLLKLRYDEVLPIGFLTKLTQKGKIPTAFDEWSTNRYLIAQKQWVHDKLPIYVFKETYKSGWKYFNHRIGQSQQWVQMIHPDQFVVEIYLDNFFDLLKNHSFINGELIGEFMWRSNCLINNEK